jgi:oxalate decarboxylase/phosphoglucose isomerase-like protein (cupin superfamily)
LHFASELYHMIQRKIGRQVPAGAFSLHNLWIFQGKLPGDLSGDEKAVREPLGLPPSPFTFSLGSTEPVRQTKGGEVRVADSSIFTVSKTIAVGLVTQRPGALREMHWHPNADEWAYWIKGKGRVTVFETGPRAGPNALFGLSKVSVGWLRLGIEIERIKPGQPAAEWPP